MKRILKIAGRILVMGYGLQVAFAFYAARVVESRSIALGDRSVVVLEKSGGVSLFDFVPGLGLLPILDGMPGVLKILANGDEREIEVDEVRDIKLGEVVVEEGAKLKVSYDSQSVTF